MTRPLCYVGERRHCPLEVREYYAAGIHPREFAEAVADLRGPIWTNNMLIVQKFEGSDVMVCSVNGIKALSEHPEYERWSKEFGSGELWSFFGEAWV